jgi:DNA-binding beta-propeller fold protein YncE
LAAFAKHQHPWNLLFEEPMTPLCLSRSLASKPVVAAATLLSICFMISSTSVFGQDATYDTVLEGLNNPTGIAVQPGTGHVFVADSGAQRVIRVVDGELEEVITDFPKDVYGKGPIYDIGPLSLAFITPDTLVVGGGGMEDGEDTINVYKVPAAGQPAIKADKIEGESMMLPKTDDAPGEGDFYGMVKTGKGVFITCNGDDAKGWIALAKLEAGKIKEVTRSIALKEETKVNAPVAITFSPDGFLAIGQMGSIKTQRDSKLTFCDPEDGEIVAQFKLGINDVSGLAYGPKRGRLFATDFNWAKKSGGGLVKIVGVDGACECRPVLSLEKPTALAFTPDGDLYVTLAGDTSEGSEADGKLIVIKGLDEDPTKDDKKATGKKDDAETKKAG